MGVERWINNEGGVKRKILTTRASKVGTAAVAFVEHAMQNLSNIDTNHPMITRLEVLKTDLKLSLYVQLSKEKKATDKAKEKGKNPKATPVGAVSWIHSS